MSLSIVISSTNIDLAEYRQIARELCQELEISVVAQEYETPDGKSAAAEFSEALVDNATCYLRIVAWRYGFVPSGRDRSVTELEYERAGGKRTARRDPQVHIPSQGGGQLEDGLDGP